MDSGQVTAIALASIISGTIMVGVIAQAWSASRSRHGTGGDGEPLPKRLDRIEERLDRLEQAIDTVAIELERGTEAQRFTAKLLAERLEVLPTARVASRDAAP